MSDFSSAFSRAQHVIPGGVNSPVRAFKAVGGEPVFIQRAKDAYLWDINDKKYIDYVLSWGPMILGHANEEVIAQVTKTLENGLSFGAPTEIETQLAEAVCQHIESIDKVRFVSSGTEATMSAIRLARGYTGRDKIIKFEGCYHGHSDSLLIKAGSGALTLGVPSSPGVPASLAEHTITLTYNDIEQVKQVFSEIGDEIAAVIVEPVAGNMNCIPPIPGFLEVLRESCTNSGAVLIFDEVMTGFRFGLGGAQTFFGITPDLTTLGKVVGGGMPVGAFGGKAEIMDFIAPVGPVYQAGTLSGNPVAMAAGLTTLQALEKRDYDVLFAKTKQLAEGIKQAAVEENIPLQTNYTGSMWGIFFTDVDQVTNYTQVINANTERFNQFFHAMLEKGVYLAPASYEAGFLSFAHSNDDIQATIDKAREVFKTF